ncbi:MAG: DsbA family protein [Rhodobacteraceae bacterium]|jgi:protein-disulfide isomerase|nr:DsbA family protein [Paracoccaceae bacterium]
MTRLPLAVAALAAALHLTAAPLAAQTMPMTDEERAAFGANVRAYLMENPEVIFEAVAEFERRTAEAQSGMDATLVEINAEEIFADGHSWVGGNLDGDLTLVEFMDYRCSFCRRAQPQMAEFLAADGNVRLIIKEFPILGPQSEVMSRFAVATQQRGSAEQYEQAHDRLMAWEGDFTETSARLLADELGLDAEDVIGHMNSDDVSAVLQANRELAQRLQISGTPTFVMGGLEGGELLRGYMPADEMQGIAARLRG